MERWRWVPKREPGVAMPPWGVALRRGVFMRCPVCGDAPAFRGFVEVREVCPVCGVALGRVPCDLLAPYVTIVSGLVVIGVVMAWADRGGRLPYGESLGIFIPLAVVWGLGLLRPVKGLVLAYMLKLGMLRPP